MSKYFGSSSTNNSASSRRPFTVMVEGNIGSGKTTFVDYFKQFNDVCVLSEPVETWKNCDGHNLLSLMYEDPQKWSFTFQSYVQLTMLQHHTLKTEKSIKLMERSIYSARHCFVEKMANDGILAPAATSVIDEWFKWITETTDISVDLIVYLRTNPEVVFERMKKRNRSEEKSVSFEYLKELHDYHENWLHHKTARTCPAPVVMIDANLDKSVIVEEYERCTPHILNKLPLETTV